MMYIVISSVKEVKDKRLPKSPALVPFQKLKALLLSHVVHIKIHPLFHGCNMKLLDPLIAGVNHSDSQKKLLPKRELTFAEVPVIFQQSNVVSNTTTKQSVAHFQRTR